jgi:hypothetical protein
MTRFFASFALATVAFALAPRALKAAGPLSHFLTQQSTEPTCVYGTGTVVA